MHFFLLGRTFCSTLGTIQADNGLARWALFLASSRHHRGSSPDGKHLILLLRDLTEQCFHRNHRDENLNFEAFWRSLLLLQVQNVFLYEKQQSGISVACCTLQFHGNNEVPLTGICIHQVKQSITFVSHQRARCLITVCKA